MSVNRELYKELYVLRGRIKKQEEQEKKRIPIVCSDDALLEIARLCPKKLSDFNGISGIGKTFIENYGKLFLEIILKYEEVPTEKAVEMSHGAENVVKELEKKLYSINRKNRLLYMPKMTDKYAFDLFQVGNKKVTEIIFKRKEVEICNTAYLPSGFTQTEVEESKYKKIVRLLREVNKDIREKGQNDLYIGYPFVIGKLSGENFDVRAPLLLFPAKIERTSSNIKVSVEEERDILYNTTLMLANFKFNNIMKSLPSDAKETYSEDNFLDSILSVYAENDIKIQIDRDELCKFREYNANEFPQFGSGELRLEPCAVLGKFSVFSNSIHKDFEEILRKKEINPLLNDLLMNAEDIDYHSNSYMGEEQIRREEQDGKLKICEHDLIYINDLNSSQEKVLAKIRTNNELVVQGPPGTGKSQTITSLISEFVSEGKNVLMVSEKKTALDVVYSRLGDLSKYSLLIDDVGDKSGFYLQLSKMIDAGIKAKVGEKKNIDELSAKIESDIARLEGIAEKLYSPDDFGIEPYKMYIKSEHFDISDREQRDRLYNIKQNRDVSLLKLKYERLEKYYNYFSKSEIEKCFKKFETIKNRHPWIQNIRDDMTESEIAEFTKKLEELNNEINVWQRKNNFVRIFAKKGWQNKADDVLRLYFINGKEESSDKLIKYVDEMLKTDIKEYFDYQKLKKLYERCDSNGKEYWRSLIRIWDVCGGDLKTINRDLFNEVLCEHIEQFEKRNQDLFTDLNSFKSIINSIGEKIDEKRNLTRQKMELKLAEGIQNLVDSKRHDELLRILENKRKWSVSKFIEKFSLELRNIKIWLLTPEVVSEIIPLERGLFDLVIFDEASQMYVEKGIPSILRAKKVVIAGDPMQLRPSSIGEGRAEIDIDDLPEDMELAAPLEEKSLLDLARFKYPNVLLNFHYRSKYEELIAFSNYAFYKGKLYVSPNTDVPEQPPIQVHKMERARWINRTNPMEAKYIVGLLEQILYNRTSEETIGVITFNSNQRDL